MAKLVYQALIWLLSSSFSHPDVCGKNLVALASHQHWPMPGMGKHIGVVWDLTIPKIDKTD